jgi:hypothetical protein
MNQSLNFDPQLPDLPFTFDRDAVTRLFEQRWPGPGESPTITKIRAQDTKYQPALRCVTTYELLAERPGAPPQRTIGVVEITPSGIAHRLYDDDPRLPWLVPATDPNLMRGRFADLLTGTAIESCAITPVRYKPGARCVFRYDLDTTAGRQVFFGKLLAEGDDQLMATIGALHDASESMREMPRIPRPLTHWPELHMLLQPEVAGGAELNDLAFDRAQDAALRERWLREAGARLAGLHATRVDGPPRTLEDDLAELREYVAPMALPNPALARRYQDAVARLATWSGSAAPPVASHGAFRTDQFMIEDDGLTMIDLDGFCWAEAARDVGNFLAYLRWKAIRRPDDAAFIERAGRVFLEGYQAANPALDERRLALYQAASLLKIAGRRFRSLTVKEWPLVPRLIDAAEEPRI